MARRGGEPAASLGDQRRARHDQRLAVRVGHDLDPREAARAQVGLPSYYNRMRSLVNLRFRQEYVDLLTRLKGVSKQYNAAIVSMREHNMVKLPKRLPGVAQLKELYPLDHPAVLQFEIESIFRIGGHDGSLRHDE